MVDNKIEQKAKDSYQYTDIQQYYQENLNQKTEKKKQKMFTSFNEINLNVFVEIARIKKP